ncbi:MAG TPA: hypothetical protein PL009_03545 [Flavipsychrobacter sp.]|nr:hypothetical protein [Flavipsychrobacter sp.]
MRIFILLGIMSIFTFSACQKVTTCANVQQVNERVYMMEKYFHPYQPGVGYIFQNRDKTKTDSIYPANFSTAKTGQNKNCLTGDLTSFDMYSSYLAGGQPMKVKLGFEESGDQITNIFEIKDASGNIITQFYAKNDELSSFHKGGTKYPVQQNYQLLPDDPSLIFPEYVRVDHLVFAPDFALIQYVPKGTNDTFSLLGFYML